MLSIASMKGGINMHLITVWSGLFLFISIVTGFRTFYSPDMCIPRNISECSFQIPDQMAESCLIYHTNVCDEYLSQWEVQPLTKPKSQNDAPVSISILPYEVVAHPMQENHPVSAINLTFTFHSKGVNGIAFNLISETPAKNICRIFDFRKLLDGPNTSSVIYYDCLYYLAEKNIQNVEMKFRLLPMNTELSYFVYIPPTGILNSVCSWKPLVVIFQGNLDDGYVNVKFTKAPEYFNVSYHVKLVLVASNEDILETNIVRNKTEDFIMVDFSVSISGYYAIWIRVSGDTKTTCNFTKTKAFFVGKSLLDVKLILYCLIVVLLAVPLTVLTVFVLNIFFNPARKQVAPRLLLVYSYDCMEHEFVILAFIKFLKTFGIEVHTIYETIGNPIKWLQNQYEEANVVIFFISEGLFHAYEKKDKRMLKVGHHCRNQLSVAESIIFHDFYARKSGQMKRFCQILFPFSRAEHVPKCVQRVATRQFYLTRKINHFLCFLFDCMPILPCDVAHNWISKGKMKNMKELKEAIDRMKVVVSENHHIHFLDEKIDELQEDNYLDAPFPATATSESFTEDTDKGYPEIKSQPDKNKSDSPASYSSSRKQFHETFRTDDVFNSLIFSNDNCVEVELQNYKPSCDNKQSNLSDSSVGTDDEFRSLVRKEFQLA